MNERQTAAKSSTELIIIGIDWADCEHVVCLSGPGGRTHVSTLEQSPRAIDEWVADLQKRFPGKTFADKTLTKGASRPVDYTQILRLKT